MPEVPAKWLEELADIARKKMKQGNIPERVVSDDTANTLWREGRPPQAPTGQVYLCWGQLIQGAEYTIYVISRQKGLSWYDCRGNRIKTPWSCICYQPITMPYNWETYRD